MSIFDIFKTKAAPVSVAPEPVAPATSAPVLDIDAIVEAYTADFGGRTETYAGEKFFGGLTAEKVYDLDYQALRLRSKQFFYDNLYARGFIRRLVTNVINTGLKVELNPEEEVLGLEAGSLGDWSEDVENRFGLYSGVINLCDYRARQTIGELEAQIRLEALINGDILIVLHIDPATKMPMTQLIDASLVQTPPTLTVGGADIIDGVEIDKRGRQVAYHVLQADSSHKRIEAINGRTKRRQAWLEYGTDKMHNDVRGEPLLSIVLQSLKEIDRYRDSAQRKAVIASIVAGFMKKTEDKVSSLPVTGGATSNVSTAVTDATANPKTRNYTVANQIPGLFMEELQQGEEPVFTGGQGTDVNFGAFEITIVQAMSWCFETPPEIMTLAFSNNYSASQAAINEFKLFQNKERTKIGGSVNQVIFIEWFISSVITGKISAPGFLAAWQDPTQYDIFAAWTVANWSGAIKLSTDILKQAKGYGMLIDLGLCTRDRASKEITGTKFSKNIKQLTRENGQVAEAKRPMLELEAEFNQTEEEPGGTPDEPKNNTNNKAVHDGESYDDNNG